MEHIFTKYMKFYTLRKFPAIWYLLKISRVSAIAGAIIVKKQAQGNHYLIY